MKMVVIGGSGLLQQYTSDKDLLRRAIARLTPKVHPLSANAPGFAPILDLEMMVLCDGKERTESEYRELLAGAGFRLTRVVPTEGPHSLVEAVPV